MIPADHVSWVKTPSPIITIWKKYWKSDFHSVRLPFDRYSSLQVFQVWPTTTSRLDHYNHRGFVRMSTQKTWCSSKTTATLLRRGWQALSKKHRTNVVFVVFHFFSVPSGSKEDRLSFDAWPCQKYKKNFLRGCFSCFSWDLLGLARESKK